MSNNMSISCDPERFVRIAGYTLVGKLRIDADLEKSRFKAKSADLLEQVVKAIHSGDESTVEAMLNCRKAHVGCIDVL